VESNAENRQEAYRTRRSGISTDRGKVSEGVTELKAFEPMCYVEVEFGYSHKLKSEDWAKFGVKLSMPAKSADINKVFDYIKAWGDEKLNAAVEELLSAE